MIQNENEWSAQRQWVCDVVVVGAGAAGITLANELEKKGSKVILLEGGDSSFTEISQAIYNGRSTGMGLPHGLSGSRLRFFGGSTNCWAGGCGELDEEDFQLREWIDSSGWPISKNELKWYYERAAHLLEIDIFRIRDPLNVAKRPVFDGFDLRSLEYTNKVRFREEFLPTLSRSDAIRVFIGANALNLNRSEDGGALSSITVASFAGSISEVRAKYFVIACGGIENARILLNSGNSSYTPLGNHSDKVGRYFCDHPIAPCATVIGENGDISDLKYEVRHFWKPDDKGFVSTPFYRIPFEVQEKYKILNAAIQFHYQEPEVNPSTVSAWRLKNFFFDAGESPFSFDDVMRLTSNPISIFKDIRNRRLNTNERMAVRFQIEQAPNLLSRITLINEKDSLGLPRIQLDWKFTPMERRTIDVLTAYTARKLQNMKIGTLQLDAALYENLNELPGDLRGGQHHSCTTRMSADEKDGVVDKNLKVHFTRNLFVVGSSVFPTNGWVNPTLTIIALSIRLADHLVLNLKY